MFKKMQYLKNKVRLFAIINILLLSCSNENKKALPKDSFSQIVENKLKKFNCIEEYNSAKYYYYCEFFDKYVTYFKCSNTNLYDSVPISFLDITLSNYISDNIKFVNDTIVNFTFDSYLNDTCVTGSNPKHEDYFSIGSITVNRRTKLVETNKGRTTAYVLQTKEEIEATLNNPKIRKFIRVNESKINNWFLEEYRKRNTN